MYLMRVSGMAPLFRYRKFLRNSYIIKNAPLWMRTTVYDISLGSKKPRQVICTSRDWNYVDFVNRARRENVASDILFYILLHLC